jgi:hypothetical protein
MMSANEELQGQIERIYQKWYADVDNNNQKEGWGELCGGITILENLMVDYTLNLNHHMTEKGVQLKKAGPALGRKVLTRFGVNIKARLGEFGRTSRGGPRAAGRLMVLLEPLHLEGLSFAERNELLLFLQKYIVQDLVRLLERSTQLIQTSSTDTFEKTLSDLLAAVPKISSGAVAQHLIGAKLKLRYPNQEISNDVTAAADAPTKRPGDFVIGDTSFHITLSPQDAVFEKCIENLNQGYKVYLLVVERTLEVAKRKAKVYGIGNRIIIKSIESFIAQNIDEIAEFSTEKFAVQKENLLKTYNRRIREANERYAPYLSLNEAGIEVEEAIDEGDAVPEVSSDAKDVYKINALFDLPSDKK